jgi:rhodanese-related sulfurtransferase
LAVFSNQKTNEVSFAGQTLKAMGYKNVRNLGAFKDWKSAGGAVEQKMRRL